MICSINHIWHAILSNSRTLFMVFGCWIIGSIPVLFTPLSPSNEFWIHYCERVEIKHFMIATSYHRQFGDFSRLFLGPNFDPIPNRKRACIFPKSRWNFKSEVHQIFSNFSSLIDEYLGIQSWLFLAYSNVQKDTM